MQSLEINTKLQKIIGNEKILLDQFNTTKFSAKDKIISFTIIFLVTTLSIGFFYTFVIPLLINPENLTAYLNNFDLNNNDTFLPIFSLVYLSALMFIYLKFGKALCNPLRIIFTQTRLILDIEKLNTRQYRWSEFAKVEIIKHFETGTLKLIHKDPSTPSIDLLNLPNYQEVYNQIQSLIEENKIDDNL